MKCLGTVRSTKNIKKLRSNLCPFEVHHPCKSLPLMCRYSGRRRRQQRRQNSDFLRLQRDAKNTSHPKELHFYTWVIHYNINIIWGCWSFSKPRILCWLFLVPSYRKPETQDAAAWNIQEHFVQIKRGKVQGIKELLKIVRLRVDGDITWYDLDNWNIMELLILHD